MQVPAIRMRLCRASYYENEDMEFAYSVPTSPTEDLTAWASRTVKVVKANTSKELIDHAIIRRNEIRPLNSTSDCDVAHLYVSEPLPGDPDACHIVFSFHHAITDARGQWMVGGRDA